MKKLWVTGAVLAGVMLAATACGSTSKTSTSATSTTTGGTTTKAAYIAKADAICTTTTKKVAALQIDLNATGTPDVAKEAAGVNQEITITQQAIAQLKALKAPSGDDAKVAAFWSAMDQQVPIVKQIASSLQTNNLQGAQIAAQQLKTAAQASDAQMAAYGLTACAQ